MTFSGLSIALHVEALRASDHVMAEVQDKQGFSPDQQLLVFVGKNLEDGFTFEVEQRSAAKGELG